MDLLMDMELPVMVRFGSTRMLLRDLLKLTAGSIIEFNRSQENPVEILVNRANCRPWFGHCGRRQLRSAHWRGRPRCGPGWR